MGKRVERGTSLGVVWAAVGIFAFAALTGLAAACGNGNKPPLTPDTEGELPDAAPATPPK